MNLLVTGGAGYIGAHFCKLAALHGHRITVLDNLSSGFREAVQWSELVVGDLLDAAALDALFAAQHFDAVVHFAALIAVSESVANPLRYYRNNLLGSLQLLEAMQRASVDHIVFSSTAAVYGNPQTEHVAESHPLAPINPYGNSKRMVEQMLADLAAAQGLRSVSLRYFNAAGADPAGLIGEAHEPETHLIPNVIGAALGKGSLQVFGDDYATGDGSCIRDYVHVNDLASAHLAALAYLQSHPGAHAFNLGNGNGFSVLEVIAAVSRLAKKPVPYLLAQRRPGDPAILVADAKAAKSLLNWTPEFTDLEAIIKLPDAENVSRATADECF